jgi:hypothetical protein
MAPARPPAPIEDACGHEAASLGPAEPIADDRRRQDRRHEMEPTVEQCFGTPGRRNTGCHCGALSWLSFDEIAEDDPNAIVKCPWRRTLRYRRRPPVAGPRPSTSTCSCAARSWAGRMARRSQPDPDRTLASVCCRAAIPSGARWALAADRAPGWREFAVPLALSPCRALSTSLAIGLATDHVEGLAAAVAGQFGFVPLAPIRNVSGAAVTGRYTHD